MMGRAAAGGKSRRARDLAWTPRAITLEEMPTGWRTAAMPLNIKKKETHEAARRLAELTGETLTEAVDKAIHERLERINARTALNKEELWQRIKQMQDDLAKAPTYDRRTAQEILDDMYDEDGLPR
jgi:antitoxin VapB